MNSISIVIPVLNEAEGIVKLLTHLEREAESHSSLNEIIVVDGGSTDQTVSLVQQYLLSSLKVKMITSQKGRARQMNTGAKVATSNILYFLHADSYPPRGYDRLILEQINRGNPAGCFRMKFDSKHWWLQLAGWFTQFRWRACRGGDQSQFITKALFEELGHYDERFIIYEDNDLINKLYARRKYVVIQEWLITSARRYNDQGIWKLQFHFWSIYVRKWFGASAEDLHKYYVKKIS